MKHKRNVCGFKILLFSANPAIIKQKWGYSAGEPLDGRSPLQTGSPAAPLHPNLLPRLQKHPHALATGPHSPTSVPLLWRGKVVFSGVLSAGVSCGGASCWDSWLLFVVVFVVVSSVVVVLSWCSSSSGVVVFVVVLFRACRCLVFRRGCSWCLRCGFFVFCL
ncbi:unnamed protein product [Arctogadus glacialis]